MDFPDFSCFANLILLSVSVEVLHVFTDVFTDVFSIFCFLLSFIIFLFNCQ